MVQRLTDDGHPAFVENRVGGNGIVATDAIAKARPDGHTLIIGNHSTLAILPHMTKVGYDPTRDFVPIALLVAAPNVLVVKASLPVNSVREIVAYGKARPLTNASQGSVRAVTSSASSFGSSPAWSSRMCTIAARRSRCRM